MTNNINNHDRPQNPEKEALADSWAKQLEKFPRGMSKEDLARLQAAKKAEGQGRS